MKENDKDFAISKDSKAIRGIKKLAQAKERVRRDEPPIKGATWYINGINYGICSFIEAYDIPRTHETISADFKALNERINARGTVCTNSSKPRSTTEEKVLVKP